MRHYFIINPVAGMKNAYDEITRKIKTLFVNENEYEIHQTSAPDDAYQYVKEKCDQLTEEAIFYACGGDGTMYEVVNGMAECEKASLAIIPVGSCNDFLKTFKEYDFLNLEKLIAGDIRLIDVIKVNEFYSINVANAGFDARVNDDVTRMSLKYKNVKKAYTMSIIKNTFQKLGDNVVVKVDGQELFNGKMLLMAFGNGKYYGGGYNCAPNALQDDGQMEVIIIKKVSRFKFARLLKFYKKGEHIGNKLFEKILTYSQAKKVIVDSERQLCFCLDGETLWDTHFELTILPKKIKMLFPKQ